MSVPLNHHFLPEFYLRAWCGEDGQLFSYRRPHRDVTVRRVFPSGTGFRRGLYSVLSRPDPVERQSVEVNLMGPIDNDASKALDYLRNGSLVSPDHRKAWTRFVLSLMHRLPNRIDATKEELRKHGQQVLSDFKRQDAAKGLQDDGETYGVFAAVEEAHAQLLAGIIDSPLISSAVEKMTWSLVRLPTSRLGLVTGDAPLMMSNGFNRFDSFIIMPTGPHEFFIAANARMTIEAFSSQNPKKLERAFNDAVVSQSPSLVVGSTDAHLKFIERRLGRVPPDGSEILPGIRTWQAPLS